MAFKMNRPIIKGTTHHKASMAKAKAQSVVSQSRTKADAGLIAASNALGKSYKPSEIDFELDKINIDVPEKKELTEAEKAARDAKRAERKAARKAKRDAKKLTPEEQAVKDAEKAKRKAKRKEIGGNIVDGVKTAIGGIVGVPLAIGNGLFKFGEDIIDEFGNKVKKAIDDIKTKGAEGKEKRAEAERIRIQAKKDAKFVGEGEIDDPETDYKNTKQYKNIKKKEKEAAKKDAAKKEARFNELMVEDEEENDFSAIENEPDVNYESSGGVDRGYKTWKHKQDAENIRLAEENKASVSGRLQAANDAGWKITNPEIGEMAREATTWNEDEQKWEATAPKITIEEVSEAAGDGGGAGDEAKKADAADKAAKGKAAKDYGTSEFAVELNEKGEYVPMEGARSEYNEVWKDGQWMDTPESEQYFGPEGEKVSKEAAEKYGETRIKKAEEKKQKKIKREEKNKAIRERNEARKYFKGKTDQPATIEEKVEALRKIKAEQEEALNWQPELEEQDDPEVRETKPVVEETTTEPVVEEKKTLSNLEIRKKRMADKKYNDPDTSQYIKDQMIKEGYVPDESKSAMNMRDNRIYRNAVKGGIVQQNMIKSGYIPE